VNNLLIASDNDILTTIIAPKIMEENIKIHTANSFEEAKKIIDDNSIKFLASDYDLNRGVGRTGLDLVRYFNGDNYHSLLLSNRDHSIACDKEHVMFIAMGTGWIDKRIVRMG
jgi:DNA-binding NtrC family response regulator